MPGKAPAPTTVKNPQRICLVAFHVIGLPPVCASVIALDYTHYIINRAQVMAQARHVAHSLFFTCFFYAFELREK